MVVSYIVFTLIFLAVACGAWGLMRVGKDILSSRANVHYATSTEEKTDEVGFYASPRQILEWGYVSAILLGGLVGIALLCLLSRLWWIGVFAGAPAGFFGFFIPQKILRSLAKRRRKKFEEQLLDALGLIRNGLQSGRGILQCLESIVAEMSNPIKEEFAIFLRQHRMGKDISECAEMLRKRMPSDDLGLALICIQINQKVGGNLSQVLGRIEQTIRSRMEIKRRVDSLTAQGKFEGLVMGMAPFVIAGILFLLDRSLMMPLFTEPIGWLAWAAVAVLEILAFAVIRVITTVEA